MARGSALTDPEISALDRVLPRVVGAFDPLARQRIVAGLSYPVEGPTPGYGFLVRRLSSCSRTDHAPSEAGVRRTLKERIVTYADVERLMAMVGRVAGTADVEDAIDRLHDNLPAANGGEGVDSEIMELCLANLGHAAATAVDAAPGDVPDGDLAFSGFGEGDGDPFDVGLDPLPGEPATESAWRGSPRSPGRVAELWDHALRAEIDGPDGQPLAELAGTMQVAVVTGYKGDPKALCQACGATMAGSTQQPVLGIVLVDEESLLKSKNHNTPSKVDALVRGLLDDGNLVVFNAAGTALPPFVEANAVRRADLASCRGLLLRVLDDLAADGVALRRERGGDMAGLVRESIGAIPSVRANAVRAWLKRACETGRVDAASEDVLLRLATMRLATPAPRRAGPQSLASVRGLETAVSSRLARLASRLRSPDGGRVGVLLSGPPGTGKTLIAGLLARESGRHFVHGSLSEWQATGYLNDFLSAIRAAFDEARRNAPSILFIDEADSIGHRSATGNRSDDYWNMVVNCMLECLQGLGERGDVAVVAATNHPGLIDPAIRREGRLGETIDIPLPGRSGRADILASLLPESGTIGLDAPTFADRIGPCSPAAIEGLVREARLLASEAGQPLALGHVEAALSQAARTAAGARSLPALAIGLASEAVMTWLAYGPEARVLGVSAEAGLSDHGRVTVDFEGGRPPSDTAGDSLRALHVALAPAAGRSLVAAGGARPGTDALDCFTHLAASEGQAARAHALALVDSGAFNGGAPPDPAMREEQARKVMAKAWPQVVRAMARARPALDAVTRTLVAHRRIDGDAFEDLVSGRGPATLH